MPTSCLRFRTATFVGKALLPRTTWHVRRTTHLGRDRLALEDIPQFLKAELPVAKLTTRLARRDHDATRTMFHAYGRIGCINTLSARSMRTKHLDIAGPCNIFKRRMRPHGKISICQAIIIHTPIIPCPEKRTTPLILFVFFHLLFYAVGLSDQLTLDLAPDGLG